MVGANVSGAWPSNDLVFDVEKRLDFMDREGIDMHVLSVIPPNFLYDTPPEVAMDLARAQNDAIAEIVQAYPGRFIGAAHVPLQNVQDAVEELDRAVEELGMTSVQIGTDINGEKLDSPSLWPFYEEAEKLDAPIIVHPNNPTGSEKMRKYYLSNLIGYPLETALGIASVIFGGVLERFGGLKFCWAHGGGFLPYQIGRLDHGYRVRPEPKTAIIRPPSEYFKMMYFDTITHSLLALEYLIGVVGIDRVLMGSDFPFDMADPNPVHSIQSVRTITSEEKKKILGSNSSKLFIK